MKRLVAMLLALLLTLSGLSALAEDAARAETISQLNLVVEEMLKKYGYNYELEKDVFYMDFELESALSSAKVEIRTYYDAVEVIVTADVRATEANREKAAVYVALVNYRIFYAQLGINMDKGHIYSRGVQLVEGVLSGMEELDVLFHMALNSLDDYGDGYARVALTGADPYETFKEVTK